VTLEGCGIMSLHLPSSGRTMLAAGQQVHLVSLNGFVWGHVS
jgi:hypothetical protein